MILEIVLLLAVLTLGVFAFNGNIFTSEGTRDKKVKSHRKSFAASSERLTEPLKTTKIVKRRNDIPNPSSNFMSYLEDLGLQDCKVSDEDKNSLLSAFKRPFQLKGKTIASLTRYEKNGDQTVFDVCETDLQSTKAILATKTSSYQEKYGGVVTMVAELPPFRVPDLPTQKPRRNSEVDIDLRSCGCSSFTECRHPFDFNDPRRLCSHLRKFFSNEDLFESGNDLNEDEREFLISRMPIGRYLVKTIYVGDYRSIVLFKFEQNYYEQWLDVWAPKKYQKKDGTRNYERFSYALRAGRWSYGVAPYQGAVLASIIETLFRMDDPLLLNQDLPDGHFASSITRALYHPEEEMLFRVHDDITID